MNQIGIDVDESGTIEAFDRMESKVDQFAAAVVRANEAMGGGNAEAAEASVRGLSDAQDRAAVTADGLRDSLGGVGGRANEAAEATTRTSQAVGAGGDRWGEAEKRTRDYLAAQQAYVAESKRAGEEALKTDAIARQITEDFSRQDRATRALSEATRSSANETTAHGVAIKNLSEGERTLLETHSARLRDEKHLEEQARKLGMSVGQLKAAQNELAVSERAAAKAAEEEAKALANVRNAWGMKVGALNSAGNAMQSVNGFMTQNHEKLGHVIAGIERSVGAHTGLAGMLQGSFSPALFGVGVALFAVSKGVEMWQEHQEKIKKELEETKETADAYLKTLEDLSQQGVVLANNESVWMNMWRDFKKEDNVTAHSKAVEEHSEKVAALDGARQHLAETEEREIAFQKQWKEQADAGNVTIQGWIEVSQKVIDQARERIKVLERERVAIRGVVLSTDERLQQDHVLNAAVAKSSEMIVDSYEKKRQAVMREIDALRALPGLTGEALAMQKAAIDNYERGLEQMKIKHDQDNARRAEAALNHRKQLMDREKAEWQRNIDERNAVMIAQSKSDQDYAMFRAQMSGNESNVIRANYAAQRAALGDKLLQNRISEETYHRWFADLKRKEAAELRNLSTQESLRQYDENRKKAAEDKKLLDQTLRAFKKNRKDKWQAEKEHLAAMRELHKDNVEAVADIDAAAAQVDKMARLEALDQRMQGFAMVSGAAASAFKKNKAVAYANALVGTASAIVSAMNTQPFMPLGLAMAVVAGINGAAQIAAISSTNVGQAHQGMDNVRRSGSWNLEGGEMVIDKFAGSAGRQLVAMAEQSMRGGGGRGGGGGVTVVVQGSVIDLRVLEQKIERAVRRAGRYGKA